MSATAMTPYARTVATLQSPDTLTKTSVYLQGTGLSPAKFLQIAVSQIGQNPALAQCDPKTILMSVAMAAQQGLEFVGGRAYLVPFGGKAQLIVGYRGLIELLYKSGMVKSVNADVVYAGEVFDYDKANGILSHKPGFRNDPKETDIIGAWCLIETTNGGRIIEAVSRSEIDKVRNASRAGSSGPWKSWYAEMCKKTVIRRACKEAPQSPALARALELDDRAEQGVAIDDLLDEPADVTPKGNSNLHDEDIPK